MADRIGDLARLDDYAPDAILPPPYRAPGQDSTAAKIGAAILTGPLRAAMYPGKVWSGEANPYEGDEATDWATGTALGMIGRGASGVPPGAIGVGGGRIVQPRLGDIAATEAVPGIRAYHSSPHDFDRFDMSKIGTGEGAQVYGHGLYFAENPAVSGQGGQYWRQFLDPDRFSAPEIHAANRLKVAGWDRAKAIEELQGDIAEFDKRIAEQKPNLLNYYTKQRDTRNKELDLLTSGKPVGPRTYEVNIAAQPEQFLDWDKALNQQSPTVVAGLKQAMRPRQWEEFNPARAGDAMNQGFIGLDKQIASEKLRDAGLPGIKYLDQGSRAAGSGTSNYVVFDPNIITILRKYGMAGMAPAGVLGSLADQSNYQPEYQ